ncbi:hypothetical protein Ddc_00038 [Ditylenchus destructor]|nr:hypothetical protein Ddc_00038 [Ditylenchus destructor]
MEKSPLAMLAKACETIGYNASNDPSPKKPKTANGTPKAINHHNTKQSTHVNGVNHNNYNADLNGKSGDGANANGVAGKHHVKKEANTAQQNRKGSPRTNGVSHPAVSCEPSTSSPLTTVSNGQMTHPFGMTPNPAMFANPANFPPGFLQRFQAPNGMHGAAPGGQPQGPFPGMPSMPMPPGFPAAGGPFGLAAMAAMAAAFGGGQPAPGMPGMPNPGAMPMPGAMRPPNPTTSAVTMPGHNPASSQAMSSTPPATLNANQKRPVPSTPTSSGVHNGQIPLPMPNPMQMHGSEAEAVFAAMAAHQQMAAMFGANPYGFPPIFGMPPMMAPGAMIQPQTQVPIPTDNGIAANQASVNSLQAILMATACGQQPRFTCTYGMHIKNGQTCGKTFDTDQELFAHYRHHLQAIIMQTTSNGTPAVSSPSQTVSSTTTEPTVSTASSAPPSTNAASAMVAAPQQNGGGKMRAGTGSLKHSPISSAPSPKRQPTPVQQTALPNNGMLWSPMPNPLQCLPPVSSAAQHPNNRFHPYAAMPKPMPPGPQLQGMSPQQQQQMMQHMHAQYEFAAMLQQAAASGLPMPGMGMPYGQLMGPPPHMMHHPGAMVSMHQAQPQTISVSAPEKGN